MFSLVDSDDSSDDEPLIRKKPSAPAKKPEKKNKRSSRSNGRNNKNAGDYVTIFSHISHFLICELDWMALMFISLHLFQSWAQITLTMSLWLKSPESLLKQQRSLFLRHTRNLLIERKKVREFSFSGLQCQQKADVFCIRNLHFSFITQKLNLKMTVLMKSLWGKLPRSASYVRKRHPSCRQSWNPKGLQQGRLVSVKRRH